MQLSSLTTRMSRTTTTDVIARASLSNARKSTQRAVMMMVMMPSSRSLASALCRPRPSPLSLSSPSSPPSSSPSSVARASGNDPASAWLDLASFVTGSSGKKGGPFEELADAIGKAAYVDVQGWHVYLSDVKVSGAPLSGILASELGPLAAQQGTAMSSADVDAFLAKVPLKLGGGKATVSLLDSIPSVALGDLHRAVEDWSRNGGR